MKINELLDHFQNVEPTATGFSVRCPAHDDGTNSLAVSEDGDKILLFCHAKCSTENIIQAVGLKMKDLFNNTNGKPKETRSRAKMRREVVATYTYFDEDNNNLYQAVRYEPKGFSQRHRNGKGEWIWETKGIRKVLYGLPDLLDAPETERVYVVEGEKDVERMDARGLLATCNVGGAGKCKTEYSKTLKGRNVVILPDNDEPGRKHAQDVAASLHGVAKSVRILELPDLPDKGDVSDWFDAGGTKRQLRELAKETPEYEPPATTDELTTLEHAEGRTEVANSLRLVARFGEDLRWCDPWSSWLAWDGKRWAVDNSRRVDGIAKEVASDLWSELVHAGPKLDLKGHREALTFIRASNSSAGVRNLLVLARSDLPILPAKLDQDPWLLNVENGTLDLRSGNLRPPSREDYITKLAPIAYDPDARCPLWMGFLKRILAGDRRLEKYLQRLVGYCLTGSTQEHILPFLYGIGANGKSTFVNTILALLGTDYAMKAPAELIMQKRNESHPTERADLFGKRFVACIK